MASRMRSFDPRAVGRLERRAWGPYSRHEWRPFLRVSVGLVRQAFRMSWPRTLLGAWLVLRANMVWAPFPDNDPAKARALMRRFYSLLREPGLNPWRAAELEVEWWRVHRERQREEGPREPLVRALQDVYSYTYSAPAEEVRRAAELRAEAMDVSDEWVEAGCELADPRLAQERALLVRSYAALLAAVHR